MYSKAVEILIMNLFYFLHKHQCRDIYDAVAEAVKSLINRGYTIDFDKDEFKCFLVNDFEIDELYRFEGMSDPADETLVYAVSSKRFALKGIIVNAYGIYEDEEIATLVQKFTLHRQHSWL